MWVWHYYVPTNFTLRHQLYPIFKNAKNICYLMRGKNGPVSIGIERFPFPSSSSAASSILLLMGGNKPGPCAGSKSNKYLLVPSSTDRENLNPPVPEHLALRGLITCLNICSLQRGK